MAQGTRAGGRKWIGTIRKAENHPDSFSEIPGTRDKRSNMAYRRAGRKAPDQPIIHHMVHWKHLQSIVADGLFR